MEDTNVVDKIGTIVTWMIETSERLEKIETALNELSKKLGWPPAI